MKKITGILFLCLIILLQGCGETETEKNPVVSSIKIGEENTILHIMIEEFDTSMYQEQELKDLAEYEISNYEETYGSDSVNVESMTSLNGIMNFQMKFKTYEDFERYTGDVLFIGTLEDAYKNGYSLDVLLKEVKSQKTIGKNELMQMAESNVIVTSYRGDVITPGKVLYYSVEATLKSGRTVTPNSEELTYIIYK
jgi:hypothetical protein